MSRHILQWHITHKCNLRCTHCYQEDYYEHTPIEKLYSYLDKYETFIKIRGIEGQINLTGGEPLLHPNLFEFASEIKKRGFRLSILTNGTLIDSNIAKRLAELKPVFIQISLDGAKEVHDSIRGECNSEKALNGIKLLKEHNIKVLVSFTAQKCNYKEYSKLVKICKQYKVDKLWWDRVVTDDPEQYLETDQFKWLAKKCNQLRKLNSLNSTIVLDNGRALQCIGAKCPGYECSAGKNLLVILADGSIMPCRRLPFIIGNMNDIQDLNEFIRKNETMSNLRNLSTPLECLSCKDRYRCNGGSKCVTYAQTGKLGIRDINCFKRFSKGEQLK